MARHIPGPLFFDQHGTQGLPMLFLHSTPDDHRLWMYQTARFSSYFRTVALDMAEIHKEIAEGQHDHDHDHDHEGHDHPH